MTEYFNGIKYFIVGAGFYGSVIAERIANDLGEQVTVIEQRNHIGGNSYSEENPETGIEVHKYGSHIFHTSNETVWNYINQFCAFNDYQHRVFASFDNHLFPIPINLQTINDFYGLHLESAEAEIFLKKESAKEHITKPKNFEEKAIAQIGRPLYEAFIKSYTIKQWEKDPKDLSTSIINRLPIRTNTNDLYFDDPLQGIPIEGYKQTFNNLLNHKNIHILLKTAFVNVRNMIPNDALLIYTGPIDEFYDCKYGLLGWRTSDFECAVINKADYQGSAVINYPELKYPYTRIHEFKHYHPERNYPDNQTVIFKEYPRSVSKKEIPFYPVHTKEDDDILMQYQNEAKRETNVIFGGRLGTYSYLNMDRVIGNALEMYRHIKQRDRVHEK